MVLWLYVLHPEEITKVWFYSCNFKDLLTWFGGLVTKSCTTLVTPWTVAHQTPLSMGFSRQEYWIGLPFPSPGDLPDPGIEPRSPALQAYSLPTELWGKPKVKWKLLSCVPLFSAPWTVVHGILQARILEWVTFPFSRGSSQPRDSTQVSCIAGGFFTSWATKEILYLYTYFWCAGSSLLQASLAAASRG